MLDNSRGSVVIVGGGVMGAATACFLARDHGVRALVLERDPTYARASSALSASSIRQQFSTPVNIGLSQWSLAFLRRIGDELAGGAERPQIGLVEAGYLYLAGAAVRTGADTLRATHAVQRACGADVVLLSPGALRARFDWLAVDDLALGAFGQSGEGWFDGPALLQAFRRKAVACGARFVAADASSFDTTASSVRAVRCTDGRSFETDAVVLCAGAWTAPLAGQLGVVLPVSAKKRDVFVLDSPAQLPNCPLVIDPAGVWFRPEGSGFIAGAPPRGGAAADADDVPLHMIDHALFDDVIWPVLATRVPAFEALRVRSAWAGYYEMNAFDHNGLAGALPGWRNAFTACGFSGHGMQHAPAVGNALAALIAGGRSSAPSIDALSVQRLLDGRPLVERNVI
jgi:FAD-dependent oxidoreductase domain-containing protein 1